MATYEKRKSANGKTSIRAKIRLKGQKPVTRTFPNISLAKKWATQTEAAIREGRYFNQVESRKHTLAETVERYKRDVLPNKSDAMQHQGAHLSEWKEEIGHLVLADITPQLLTECRDTFAKRKTHYKTQRSPATVNRLLAAISHVFSIASAEWGWIEHNPVKKVRKLKEPRGRVRFLSDNEREALLRECEASDLQCLLPIVVLALATGMRRGEILGLRWENVDLLRGRLVLEETKNGERRGVALGDYPLKLLKLHNKVRRLDTDLVFPSQSGNRPLEFRGAWNKALKKAEIENFRFHDLRHSAASYLAMNGATPAEIAEILGHKTLAMVKRYAHLCENHTAKVVGDMNEKIFG